MGVCIPAAGSGTRMGGARKPFLELLGEPLLLHTLRPFLEHERVEWIVIALPLEQLDSPPRWLAGLGQRIALVEGGPTRGASVLATLEALGEGARFVLIHDAARPLVTRETIDRCLDALEGGGGVVAGWPVVDTLKEVDGSAGVLGTPDRSHYWSAQTPQAFPRLALLEAYRSAAGEGVEATDDAAVFARSGGAVRMVEGDPWNLKVTVPLDLEVAAAVLRARDPADAQR